MMIIPITKSCTKKRKKKKEKHKDLCNISTDRDEFSLFTGCTVIHYNHQDVLKTP